MLSSESLMLEHFSKRQRTDLSDVPRPQFDASFNALAQNFGVEGIPEDGQDTGFMRADEVSALVGGDIKLAKDLSGGSIGSLGGSLGPGSFANIFSEDVGLQAELQRAVLHLTDDMGRTPPSVRGGSKAPRSPIPNDVDDSNLYLSILMEETELEDTPLTKLTKGTGPAFEAFGERAVQHRYITQPALDAIRNRIEILPALEQEDALVCAMRRFCACTQPMSSVVLSGHVLGGFPARLVGCAPPGGTPEVYNVAVMMPDTIEPLLIQVEPKHFRPAPIERDARDDMHERIPADHEAEAWFAERILASEMMFRAEESMGASFGPKRPR